jgi:hypothetical protein
MRWHGEEACCCHCCIVCIRPYCACVCWEAFVRIGFQGWRPLFRFTLAQLQERLAEAAARVKWRGCVLQLRLYVCRLRFLEAWYQSVV